MKPHEETVDIKEYVNDHHTVDVAQLDASMMIMTWICFFVLLAILQKFAWKPILTLLDKREKDIQESVENADLIKEELEQLESKTRQMIQEAEEKGKSIVEEARHAAVEASRHIEKKAKDEAKILLDNARRELKEDFDRAQAQLREESAQLAVELAGKILEENLDSEKNKKLVNRIIQDM